MKQTPACTNKNDNANISSWANVLVNGKIAVDTEMKEDKSLVLAEKVMKSSQLLLFTHPYDIQRLMIKPLQPVVDKHTGALMKDFKCKVCNMYMVQAYQIEPCECIVCGHCLQQIFVNGRCPICKRNYDSYHELDNIEIPLRQMPYVCPYGCKQQFKDLCLAREHVLNCANGRIAAQKGGVEAGYVYGHLLEELSATRMLLHAYANRQDQ